MLYPELEQKIKAGVVKVGDLVWVTAYYHDTPLLKPTRRVAPILTQITSNTALPAIRRIPSSSYHFRPCGKSGKLLSKVILPYEGPLAILWSSGDHGSISIFFTESEARASYVAAANVVKLQIAEALRETVDACARLTAEVDERIAEDK